MDQSSDVMSLNESLNNKDKSNNADLPSINERLAYLRPSRELLEYYRKKIADYDTDREDMTKKLEVYKSTYEEQHKLQWEMRQREEEIGELQKALSDMQVYLFQEREHVLRLYAQNDRLKIRELEDRKKIQTLLTLSGMTEEEVSYFLKEPPAKAIVPQKIYPKGVRHPNRNDNGVCITGKKIRMTTAMLDRDKKVAEELERHRLDSQSLVLQIESLQAQLAEQTKLAKEQVEGLLEDRRVKSEEFETLRQRDDDKIRTLTQKLHKTQDLLYDSTKDFLELRYEGRAHERRWMCEKDRFLCELDNLKQQLNIDRDVVLQAPDSVNEYRVEKTAEFKALEYENKQTQKLADMYREQVIQLEDELAKIREKDEVGKEIFKDKAEKLAKRLEIMNVRYTELEKRRNLEVEGFRTDIKHLRQRLKELEKQLFKLTIGFGEDLDNLKPDEIDLHVLRNVRRTAGRSDYLVNNLKTLKAKVYGMENDLRHL